MADLPQTKAEILQSISKAVGYIAQTLHRTNEESYNPELLKLRQHCIDTNLLICASMGKEATLQAGVVPNEKKRRLAKLAKRRENRKAKKSGGSKRTRSDKAYQMSVTIISAAAKSTKTRARDIIKICVPAVANGCSHLLGTQSQIPAPPTRSQDLVVCEPFLISDVPYDTAPPHRYKADRVKHWNAKERAANRIVFVRLFEQREGLNRFSVLLPESKIIKLFPLLRALLIEKRTASELFDRYDELCWDPAASRSDRPFYFTLSGQKAIFTNGLVDYANSKIPDDESPYEEPGKGRCAILNAILQWSWILEGPACGCPMYNWVVMKKTLVFVGDLLGVEEKYVDMVRDSNLGDIEYMNLFNGDQDY